MRQKGEHTWDLIVHYHACPSCGYIQESRIGYSHRLGKFYKDLTCERCHAPYQVEKKRRSSFAPLCGEPEPASPEWETN